LLIDDLGNGTKVNEELPLQYLLHFQRLTQGRLTSTQPGGSEKSQSTPVLPHCPLDLELILLFAACSTVGMHERKVTATRCRTKASNKLWRR